ncbi:extracellular solute-binding protein [Paracoccus sp. (in: a-proteobacteria)]|uniref:extracellular solute-binding protein n=1 Tax=Paracoccus sp. TaxID=267 RepID=UPI0026E0D3B2|nr:extracellular solute-binding protein [Paracoccus sp. (in: a-proteobacteria)]MDO5647528.1 extracellular solute-binding protein [Paracoccus sp. (in: a-proteobacteria)]
MLRKTLMTAACALSLALPAMADDLLSKPWDEIVAQAKAEGELTWYVWYFQPEFRQQAELFTQETGIKVTIPDVASNTDALNKVLAESGRERGDVDVIALGGGQLLNLDASQNFWGPILPALPESDAVTDKAEGADSQGYAVAYWGNQTGFAYDSNRVDVADLPQSLADLEQWMSDKPGTFGFNYEKGGSGPSFIQNVTRNVLGITPENPGTEKNPDATAAFQWFNDRADQYILTASNADSLTRLNSGEFLIVPAWEDHLFSLQNKNEVGSHIHFYIPGLGMNGGGNLVAIPKNAPHKAASLVFVAWLTGADTQTRFNQTFGTAPQNVNADDSKALVPAEQRVNRRDWILPPDNTVLMPEFIKEVVEY